MIAMPMIGAYADSARAQAMVIAAVDDRLRAVHRRARVGRARRRCYRRSSRSSVSNFFFQTGVSLIGAFLPEIARPHALGKVSGWGWSFGYLGGLATLAVCLAYVTWSRGRGGVAEDFVPVTMLITAGVFALAALPTLFILRERAVPQGDGSLNALRDSISRLASTLKHHAPLS